MDINKDILVKSLEHSNLAHSISLAGSDLPLSYVNKAFTEQTGYSWEDSVGKNCRFLQGEGTDPIAIKKIKVAIKNEEPIDIEILNYKKDGTPFWNHLRLSPIYDNKNVLTAFIGIQSDITPIREKMRIERERQKLAAMGRVSSNINHEIKNTLQPIKMVADIFENWENLSSDEINKCLKMLKQNINLANSIVRSSLTYAKNNKNEYETCSFKVIAHDVAMFAKNTMQPSIRTQININEDQSNSLVSINRNALYQITLNLTQNACDAMKAGDTLKLYFDICDIKEDSAAANILNHGQYIKICFEDEGHGIPKENIKKIFEPFFSTKSFNARTGLGLSVSYTLAKEMGGTLIAESIENKGTKFSIYLPVVKNTV